MGAFGAHALKDVLTKRNAMDNWRTAVMYQLVQATALLGVSALVGAEANAGKATTTNAALAGHLMTAGTFMFSGSIYMLCLGIGPTRVLGPTTPVGGLFMIAGWVVLAF